MSQPDANPTLKPIRFLCRAVIPMRPKEIAGLILDVSCWGDFQGCWPIPGILSAEYEERTAAIIGSRIRVRNSDGSAHVEEVIAWIPDRLVQIRLDDFSVPLKWLATHFTETWQFERDSPAGTAVSRMFELQPVSVLTWPAVWVLSRCLRRAVCRHLRAMAAS